MYSNNRDQGLARLAKLGSGIRSRAPILAHPFSCIHSHALILMHLGLVSRMERSLISYRCDGTRR